MPPVHRYRVITPDDSGETFEVEQAADAPTLKKHPLTGEPVERLYEDAATLTLRHDSRRDRTTLSSNHLAKHGFARYEKDPASGSYHKTAGAGPEHLQKG